MRNISEIRVKWLKHITLKTSRIQRANSVTCNCTTLRNMWVLFHKTSFKLFVGFIFFTPTHAQTLQEEEPKIINVTASKLPYFTIFLYIM